MPDMRGRFKHGIPVTSGNTVSENLLSNFDALKRFNDFRVVELPFLTRSTYPLRVIIEQGVFNKNQDTNFEFSGTDEAGVPFDSNVVFAVPDVPPASGSTLSYSEIYMLVFLENNTIQWIEGPEFDPVLGSSMSDYPVLTNLQTAGDNSANLVDALPLCYIEVPNDRTGFEITNDDIVDARPFLSTAKRLVDLEDVNNKEATAMAFAAFNIAAIDRYLTGLTNTQSGLDNSVLTSNDRYLTGVQTVQDAFTNSSAPSATNHYLTDTSVRQEAITNSSVVSGDLFLAGALSVQAALDASINPSASNQFLVGINDIQDALTNPLPSLNRNVPTSPNPFATFLDFPQPEDVIAVNAFVPIFFNSSVAVSGGYNVSSGMSAPLIAANNFRFSASVALPVAQTGTNILQNASGAQSIPQISEIGTKLSGVDISPMVYSTGMNVDYAFFIDDSVGANTPASLNILNQYLISGVSNTHSKTLTLGIRNHAITIDPDVANPTTPPSSSAPQSGTVITYIGLAVSPDGLTTNFVSVPLTSNAYWIVTAKPLTANLVSGGTPSSPPSGFSLYASAKSLFVDSPAIAYSFAASEMYRLGDPVLTVSQLLNSDNSTSVQGQITQMGYLQLVFGIDFITSINLFLGSLSLGMFDPSNGRVGVFVSSEPTTQVAHESEIVFITNE